MKDVDPYADLACCILRIALKDAMLAYTRSTIGQAAEARFWLLFGVGADLAEALGIDEAVEKFVLALPPLPGQRSSGHWCSA